MGDQRWGEPIEQGKPVAIDSEGTVVVGRYLEYQSFLQEGKRESRIHEVELGEGFHIVSAAGVSLAVGDSFRFWGSYDLDQKLRRIEHGELVRIEFKGLEELSAAGDGKAREMKRFEVRRALGASPRPRGGTDNPPF